jgi:hypothetical protein
LLGSLLVPQMAESLVVDSKFVFVAMLLNCEHVAWNLESKLEGTLEDVVVVQDFLVKQNFLFSTDWWVEELDTVLLVVTS